MAALSMANVAEAEHARSSPLNNAEAIYKANLDMKGLHQEVVRVVLLDGQNRCITKVVAPSIYILDRCALLRLRPLSVGPLCFASLSAKKYATAYFSVLKRTSKYSRGCSQSVAELLCL